MPYSIRDLPIRIKGWRIKKFGSLIGETSTSFHSEPIITKQKPAQNGGGGILARDQV